MQTKYFDLCFVHLVWLEIAFHFILKGVLKTQLLPLIKGQKKCFAQTKIFFSLYFWLENNWSKTTQKRSVLASEPRIQLPEKLLFSFQYKVLSAEGGKCAAYSSTHLQPNLLNNTSPRWMPSTEDKVRPLEDKFSRSKQNEAWIQPTCLSSSKA